MRIPSAPGVRFPARIVLAAALLASSPLLQAQQIDQIDPQKIVGHAAGPERDDIVPGELVIDPPTFENLGFRWFIEGDSNRNASVTVAWRKAGEESWREALPMLRVHHEIVTRATTPYRVGNLFAGSVFFLEPGAAYEVRFTMTDPDGGAPSEPKVLRVETRAEPPHWEGARTLRVVPSGGQPGQGAYASLAEALEVAGPGDVVFLEEGEHRFDSWVTATRSGEPNRPLVIRGAGAGRTVLRGPNRETDLLRIKVAHITIEDLTVRTARSAIQAGDRGGPAATYLTVRRCAIEDVINGIWSTSENAHHWLISDNVITGTDEWWHPRPSGTYMAGSHTGINLYGQGHVIRHNRISRFSDALAIANFSRPDPGDIHRHAVNIDFHNNDLSFAVDDTFEADYGCHNIRFYRNRCYNTHTALSVQPSYGGPIYLIRNEAFQITSLNFKWNNHGSGLVAYHNTLVSSRTAFYAPPWSNGHLRNNLLIGGSGRLIATGTLTPNRTTLDYNGYHGNPDEPVQVNWISGDADPERAQYASLAEFSAATGMEKHGMVVSRDIFVKLPEISPDQTVTPDQFDLRLKPGAAPLNAGVRLPNINDDHTGAAPDLGTHESGQPPPSYGPRGH